MGLAGGAKGQYYIDDGETESVSSANKSYGKNIIMGLDTSGNGLRVYGGYTASGKSLVVGYAPDSTNNWVQLRANSALSLSGDLYVGYDSSLNDLSASDGALVYVDDNVYIGYYDAAESNSVVISGEDAYWVSGGNIYVGYGGNDNTFELSDNATLYAAGSIWIGRNSTADNNTMWVSDAAISNAYEVVVGYEGEGNALYLEDGAELTSYNAYVGVTNSADDNLIWVDSDSTWTNNNDLYVGNEVTTGNRVTVTNGGSIVLYGDLEISGTDNTFNLENGGSLTIYTNFNASTNGFNFNEGGTLYVGGELSGLDGTIEDGRTVGLTGSNGWWNLAGSNVIVGSSTSGNGLYVEDGALVESDGLWIGADSTAFSNTVSVSGTNSWLDVAGDLTVGAESNAYNVVEVSSNGTIVVGGALTVAGTDNEFNLGDGGWLVVSNGLDASMEGFNFLSGGTLESLGALTGLDASIEDQRTILLSSTNASWNVGTNVLQVGYTSSSNELYVTDGAYLASGGALIGSASTTGSLVYISGENSLWENSGDLTLNGYYNDLVLSGGASVAVDGTVSVLNGSSISFYDGATATAENYYQDADSVLAFDESFIDDDSASLLVVSDTAELESGATVEYVGAISSLDQGVTYSATLIDANTLIVAGVTNATDADLAALNVIDLGSLLSVDLVTENDDLMALITRLQLADSAGFAEGSDMAGVSEELDLLADSGNELAETMLSALSDLDSDEQNEQLSQLYDRHTPSYAHVSGMMDGFKQVRERGVVPGSIVPQGAMGPHIYGTEAQVWIKGYGSWGERDDSGAFSGYDLTTYGAVVGYDKSHGDLLLGVAGGMATTDISQNDGDSSEASTGYGLLYASYGTLSWFGDLNLGFGRSTIEETSGTSFDTSADFSANQLGFYMGGGKEMAFSEDRLFITPSAALSGSYYMQDSYTEKSTTSVARKVDAYEHLGLQSEFGVSVSYAHDLTRSVLMPEVHANWIHEFNADEEDVSYSLIGGTGDYSFSMQAPVEDLFEVGAGLSWWKRGTKATHEWSVGLDGRFGDGYTETTASLRLIRQF
jgi:outer membrane autotransporter protein